MMNNENGRSMVEMLGVLAIIGVLSVAGIAGYTTAMRGYRANEMIQAASSLYGAARSSNGGVGNVGRNYNSNFGYAANATLPGNAQAIDYVFDEDTSDKYIQIQAQDNADCRTVQNKLGTDTTQMMYVDADNSCGENGDTLRIYFQDS